MNPISFTVHGKPAPAGSKTGFYNKHTGRVVITDANEKNARPWKALIHDAALKAKGDAPLLEGPVMIEMTFWMPRPKSHFGTGKRAGVLKPNAPRFHTSAPDALKLARGCEDALKGLIYRDDSQIAIEFLQKVYGEPARVEVRVVPIEQTAANPENHPLPGEREGAAAMQLPLAPREEAA